MRIYVTSEKEASVTFKFSSLSNINPSMFKFESLTNSRHLYTVIIYLSVNRIVGFTSCSRSHLLTLGSKYTSLVFSSVFVLSLAGAFLDSKVLFCFSIYFSRSIFCCFYLVYRNCPYALLSTTSRFITNPSLMWIGLIKMVLYLRSIYFMFLIWSRLYIFMCWFTLISSIPYFFSYL